MAERPLSPHLSVYKWTYTMALSTLHRLSGLALAISLIGLTAWLASASLGADAYQSVMPWLASVPFKIILALVVLAMIFHLCNGVRHLAWDLGWGFERSQAHRSAWLVIAVALIGAAIALYFLFAGAA